MPPPVTFDGLSLKDDIIQFIYDLLMARLSCLRSTLSRGVSAYLASRVERISTPTRYSEMLKCSNLKCHLRDRNISIYRINRRLLYSDPWVSSSLESRISSIGTVMLARHHHVNDS